MPTFGERLKHAWNASKPRGEFEPRKPPKRSKTEFEPKKPPKWGMVENPGKVNRFEIRR